MREYYGKQLLAKYIGEMSGGEFRFEGRGILVKSGVADVASPVTWDTLLASNPWAKACRLVAKPDQLIKRRGKAGLIAIDKSFDECKAWVNERMNKTWNVEGVEGKLDTFLPGWPPKGGASLSLLSLGSRLGQIHTRVRRPNPQRLQTFARSLKEER